MTIRRTALLVAAGTLAATLGTALPSAAAANPCNGTVCSFNVPPGTYEITVTLGSKTAAANTGLDVEARRTVLAPVATSAGKTVQESVTVNVRTPESMPDGQEGNGTAGLQVYLTGKAPALPRSGEPRPHATAVHRQRLHRRRLARRSETRLGPGTSAVLPGWHQRRQLRATPGRAR